jgi:hypothetical protein
MSIAVIFSSEAKTDWATWYHAFISPNLEELPQWATPLMFFLEGLKGVQH